MARRTKAIERRHHSIEFKVEAARLADSIGIKETLIKLVHAIGSLIE